MFMGQTNMLAFALQAAVCVPRKTKRGSLAISPEMCKNVSAIRLLVKQEMRLLFVTREIQNRLKSGRIWSNLSCCSS